jgi:hypothetical protein
MFDLREGDLSNLSFSFFVTEKGNRPVQFGRGGFFLFFKGGAVKEQGVILPTFIANRSIW